MNTFLVLLVFLPHILASPTKLQNITILAPEGSSNHSDPKILCTPTKSSDVLIFFLGNYFAHLATIRSLPGEPILPLIGTLLIALLFPVSGVIRGLDAVYEAAIFKKTSLQSAIRAGAVFQVVRTKAWRPVDGDVVRNIEMRRGYIREPDAEIPIASRPTSVDYEVASNKCFWPATTWYSSSRQRGVHGTCELPPGFAIAAIDARAKVLPSKGRHMQDPTFDAGDTPKESALGDPTPQSLAVESPKMETVCRQEVMEPQPTTSSNPPASLGANTSERFLESIVLKILFVFIGPSRAEPIISTDLSSHYSSSTALVAILQLVFASLTIYQARGDQISRFGYAAFGLTVSPYLVMSFVNLLGSLLTPSYSHVYLVSSDVMEEAIRRGGYFDGVIGALDMSSSAKAEQCKLFNVVFHKKDNILTMRPLTTGDQDTISQWMQGSNDGSFACQFQKTNAYTEDLRAIIHPSPLDNVELEEIREVRVAGVGLAIGCIPLAIIGGLTSFHAGGSTAAQRGWTMAWLVTGIGMGITPFMGTDSIEKRGLVIYCAPAIGGMVMVGKMLMEYGHCVKIF